jgi:hypothetical protein
VYDPKTKNKIYNDLQLFELHKADKVYSYRIDFSQKFNYCLCSVCHNVMTKLKKSQARSAIRPKTSKPVPKLTRSGSKTSKSQKKTSNSDVIEEIEEIDKVEFERNLMDNKNDGVEYDDFEIMKDPKQNKDLDIETENDEGLGEIDEVNDSEIEELEDEDDILTEISFKLAIRIEGKNNGVKWETIYKINFDNFMKDLYGLIQNQVDELVLRNDYIISYRNAKGSGIGTYLSDEKDWMMFLKEYQKLNSQEKEMMIIASQNFKKAKSIQINKR